MTAISVRIAQCEASRAAAFRLRYEVFIEEMRMPLAACDPALGIVRDPEDDDATIYLADDAEGRLVGSFRLCVGSPMRVEAMDAIFATRAFARRCGAQALSFTGRLVIRHDARGGTVLATLARRFHRDLLDRGICFDFLVCTPGLLPLYEAIGYRLYKPAVWLPDLGYRLPLVLDVRDGEHLWMIRSPLRSSAAMPSGGFRLADIDGVSLQPRFADREALERRLAAISEALDQGIDSPLAAFDAESLRALLLRFRVLQPAAGDTVIVAGTMGDELFVVLRGSVASFAVTDDGLRPRPTRRAGQCFGIDGFLRGGCRNEQAVVIEAGCELLVVDAGGFARLEQQLPALATRLRERLHAARMTPLADKVAAPTTARPDPPLAGLRHSFQNTLVGDAP